MSRRFKITVSSITIVIVILLASVYFARTALLNAILEKYTPESMNISLEDIGIGWKTLDIKSVTLVMDDYHVNVGRIDILYWQTDYSVEHGVKTLKLHDVTFNYQSYSIRLDAIIIDNIDVFRSDLSFARLVLENLFVESSSESLKSLGLDKMVINGFSVKEDIETGDRQLMVETHDFYGLAINYQDTRGLSVLKLGSVNLKTLHIESVKNNLARAVSVLAENFELSNKELDVHTTFASLLVEDVLYHDENLEIRNIGLKEIYHEPASESKTFLAHFPQLDIAKFAYNKQLVTYEKLSLPGDSRIGFEILENGNLTIVPQLDNKETLQAESQVASIPDAEVDSVKEQDAVTPNTGSLADIDVKEDVSGEPANDEFSGEISTTGSITEKNMPPEEVKEQGELEDELQFFAEKTSIEGSLAVSINDKSIAPSVRHDLLVDTFELHMLDTRKDSPRAIMHTHATIHNTSDINLKSEFHPGKQGDFMIEGKFTKIDLVTLSPYIVSSTGYSVHSGEIDLKIDTVAEDYQLDGEARIHIRKLKLETVDQELASSIGKQLSMPLPTALKILRDKDKNITLDIPIEGHMDDPDFGLGSISKILTVKALKMVTKNYVKNAIFPSSLLVDAASFFAGSVYDAMTAFPPIIFTENTSELNEEAVKIIDEVASFINKKDDVYLKVCPVLTKEELGGLNDEAIKNLADARQKAVRSALLARKVNADFLMNCQFAIEDKGKPLVYLPMN